MAVKWLNESSDDLTYSVGKIRIDFPLELRIEEVAARYEDGRPFLSVGKLHTGLNDIPLNQPYFMVRELLIEDVVLGMDSLTESLGVVGTVEKLYLTDIAIDPAGSQLHVGSVKLGGPDVVVALGPSVPDTTEESQPWRVSVDDIHVTRGEVTYDCSDLSLRDAIGSVSDMPYLDYDHLRLSDLSLQANDFVYDGNDISVKIGDMTAREDNCGLEIEQLKSDFVMHDSLVTVRNLELEMPESRVRGEVALCTTFFDSLHIGFLDADLSAVIDSADMVRLVAPYVPAVAQYWPNQMARMEIKTHVNRDTVELNNLSLKVDRRLDLRAEGFGLHPWCDSLLSFNATVMGDLTRADFLLSSFVDAPEARDYRLPDSLYVKAEVSMSLQRMMADVLMRHRDSLVLQGRGLYDTEQEAYQLDAVMHHLEAAAFSQMVPVDGITASMHVDGRHYAFPGKNTRLEAELHVDTLTYINPGGRHDRICDIMLQASLLGGQYVAQLHTGHPALRIDSHLEGAFHPDSVSARGYVSVPKADLAHLPAGLAMDWGRCAVRVDVDGYYDWGDNARLTASLDSMIYDDGAMVSRLEKFDIQVEADTSHVDADLRGGDLMVCLESRVPLTRLPDGLNAFTRELDHQLSDFTLDLASLQHTLPQSALRVKMAQHNPVYPILNNYYDLTLRSLDLNLDNDASLNLALRAYGVGNATTRMDTVEVSLKPDDRMADAPSSYRYVVHANHIDARARKTYDIHAKGKLMPDSIVADVQYVDGNYLTHYDASAAVAIDDDTITVRLLRDPVIYAQPFKVNHDNYIRVSEFKHPETARLGVRAKLKLEGPKEMLLNLYTRKIPNEEVGNQFALIVRNLDLAYLARTMEWNADVDGRFNMLLASELRPDSIAGSMRGRIERFRISDYDADTLKFDARFHLIGKEMAANGTFAVDSLIKVKADARLDDSIRVNAHITELPLQLANAFMPNNIRLKGETSGMFSMRGKDADHATMRASLSMHEAEANYADCDATIKLPEDTLRLERGRIEIRDYRMLCANKNPLVLSGLVDLSKNMSDPKLDLTLAGSGVRLFKNSKPRTDQQYICGVLPVDANIKVRGNVSNLDVSGRVRALSGTSLIYDLKDDPLRSESRVSDLVEFVSFRQIDRIVASDSTVLRRRPKTAVVEKEEGVKVDLKIEIAKNAVVLVNLTPGTEDRVSISGGGSLRLLCAPNGSLTMSGTYDITGGDVNYKLPMLPMTKAFQLSNVSYVSWSGPVDDPDIHLVAVEEVRCTINDVSSGSRLVKFNVTIDISGKMGALNVTFTCDAPEDGALSSEIASLTDEERSKQALLLLIAQTYTGPGVTSNVGIGSANAALNSVLQKEVESLLSNKLKNTDINVGIDSYDTQTGANRTDYSVKVSQRLFHDHMRVTVGGRVSSGAGESASGQEDAIINDVSVEWLFKKDASQYLRLFRKTNYQSVLEGELVENGIGYVQERQAFRFRQLFVPASKRRKALIMQMVKQYQEEENAEAEKNRQPEPSPSDEENNKQEDNETPASESEQP